MKAVISTLATLLLLFNTTTLAAQPTIAVIAPVTGRYEFLGKDISQAVRLAVREINESGGLLGQQVAVKVFDNGSDLQENLLAAQKVVKGRYACVIGPVISSRALAAAKLLQKAGIPMIAPGSSATAVTQVGDYIFRSNFTSDFQGRIMAFFALRRLGAKTAAILIHAGEIYSAGLGASFKRNFEAIGGKVIYTGQYLPAQTNFIKDLSRIKLIKAEFLLIPGYDKEAAAIIEQARAMGITIPIMGGEGWSTNIPSLVKKKSYMDNCYEVRHFSRAIATDRARTFLADYIRAFGPMRHDAGALAYDAVLVYAEAVRKAGSFDNAMVKDALYRVSVKGITGSIRFNSTGDPEKSALIVTYREGQPVYFMTIEP